MRVEELAAGLWRWSARLAGEEVWSVYYEAPEATVLIDPVVPEDEAERFFRALDRDVERRGVRVVIVCTSGGLETEAAALAARYGAAVVRA